VFGRTGLALIAMGCGATITDVSQFRPLFEACAAQDKAEGCNAHISGQMMNPRTGGNSAAVTARSSRTVWVLQAFVA
jgi:hypothetical protein